MRVAALLSIIGFLILSQPGNFNYSTTAVGATSFGPAFSNTPSITSIRMKGNKLIVIGDSFGSDASITIDFVEQRTKPDPDFPGQRLVAPKARKHFELNRIVSVRVANSPLNFSEPVNLIVTETLWARVLKPDRFTPTPSSLHLATHDYLLLDLPGNGSELAYLVTLDQDFFSRVTDPAFDTITQQLYRVEQPGNTEIRIELRYSEPAPTFLTFDVLVN